MGPQMTLAFRNEPLVLRPSQRASPFGLPAGSDVLDVRSPFPEQRIGEILISIGALDADSLDQALKRQGNEAGPPLGSILLSEGLVSESVLASGLALQSGVWRVEVTGPRLDLELVELFGPDRCLRHGLVPWRHQHGQVVVATARPERFGEVREALEAALGPVRMAITEEEAVREAILARRSEGLTRLAETRPDPELSVRHWAPRDLSLGVSLLAAVALTLLALAPVATLVADLLLGLGALTAMTYLKLWALLARRSTPPDDPEPEAWPRVSILVPLLCEAEITDHLIGHLTALDYPEGQLEVILVTEAEDTATSTAIGHNRLPQNFRRVEVPRGRIRTKPRALNYALDFSSGEIVGVYDAEDAPEPDQLRKVAARFAAAPEEVVCLQGRLDFYNPAQNWLSRCFTLDYAAWFRVVLPGLAQAGFAIPLGGTTVFFRREALEALGRWDAHNVTEDADLGIRLARAGWRTELVETTTYEEANCRTIPWIRQRTRWIKGYALTWAVHMRAPGKLWRELGAKQFLGFQVMFAGTIALFLAAPLFWSFWVLTLGLSHPVAAALPVPAIAGVIGVFVMSGVVNLTTAAIAASGPRHRWLLKWVPTLFAYFPLASLAAVRAIADIGVAPFYWDKTRHGISMPAAIPRFRSRRSVSGGIRRRG